MQTTAKDSLCTFGRTAGTGIPPTSRHYLHTASHAVALHTVGTVSSGGRQYTPYTLWRFCVDKRTESVTHVSCYSVVSPVTRLRTGLQRNHGVISGRSNRLLPKACRPPVGPTESATQWISRVLSQGAADHSPPCIVEVWSCTSIPHTCRQGIQRKHFTLTLRLLRYCGELSEIFLHRTLLILLTVTDTNAQEFCSRKLHFSAIGSVSTAER